MSTCVMANVFELTGASRTWSRLVQITPAKVFTHQLCILRRSSLKRSQPATGWLNLNTARWHVLGWQPGSFLDVRGWPLRALDLLLNRTIWLKRWM